MASFKAVVFSGLFLFALTGCDPIRGAVQVNETFDAIVDEGRCSGHEGPCADALRVRVEPGDYWMTLAAWSEREIELEFNGPRVYVMKLKINGRGSLPSNGPFRLLANQTGQPFHLVGRTETIVTETAPTTGVQTCEIVTERRLCRRSQEDPQKEACETHRVTRDGQRQVEYLYRTTKARIRGEITTTDGRAVAALDGGRSSAERLYTFRGACE